MPVAITLKGMIEPINVDEDFIGMANALNMTSAQGKEFAIVETTDGQNVAISMKQILFIGELDGDEKAFIG